MKNKIVKFTLPILFILISQSINSQDRIPSTSGVGGFALLGLGYFNVESNLIVKGSPLIGDVGNTNIESIFEKPNSQTAFALPMGGELNYTFSSTRTQLYFGNRLEDLLRLDLILGLGVRQELPDESIIAASFLFTPFELKYWADPYVEGEDRIPTELNFPGLRVRWGSILETGLELTSTTRWYRHDEEKSGDWLISEERLDSKKQTLLNRDGIVWRLQALYRIDVDKQHRFEPAIRYVIDEHDGEAITNKGMSFQLTYIYFSPTFILDFNLLYGFRNFNEVHPVYDETLNLNRWGLALSGFFPVKRFEGSVLNVLISGEIFQEDVNVDFFDSKIASVNVGVLWRFLKK